MERITDVSQINNVHFTYKSNPDMRSLCQGDIIEKTNDIIEILKEVHPYFVNDSYKYFMVLSQSCDLVRRDGKKCKTPYITLAAVREYGDFIEKTLVANKMAENCRGFLLVDDKTKMRVTQLIERIYNNTEPDYFFLYKEDALNFPKSMIVYLKVSIALKSALHYQVCLNSKRLELSDEFKAKLGWLVGNMYSRVGTTDWGSKITEIERKKMIEDDINSHCIIGTKNQLKELKSQLDVNSSILNTHDDVIQFLSTVVVKSNYEQVMDIIENTFQITCKNIGEEDKRKLFNAIKSSKKIQTLIK